MFEEIRLKTFLIWGRNIQVQEAQRYPDKMIARRSTPKHIKIAKVKDKERIIKAARDKDFLHTRETP